jgi:hypothetical protein
MGDEHSFDLRAWGRGRVGDGRARQQACEQLESAGRSLAASAPAGDRAAVALIDPD